MKFKEYVDQVLKTESNDFVKIGERTSLPRNIRLMHTAVGIMTEISELFEMEAKPELDLTNLMEECSDALWYIGVGVDELGLDRDAFFQKCQELKRKDVAFPKKSLLSKKVLIRDVLSKSQISSSKLLDLLKKSIFYGREIDLAQFENTMAEVMSEMILLLESFGYSVEESMDINIDKLQKKRFKAGKFTEQEAIVRNLDEERKTLEKKD